MTTTICELSVLNAQHFHNLDQNLSGDLGFLQI